MGRPQLPNPDRAARYQDWMTDQSTFTSATFDAHLDPKNFSFDPNGALKVTLVIPPGQVDQALTLRHLLRLRFPLTCTINVKDDFTDLLAAQSATLHALPPVTDPEGEST